MERRTYHVVPGADGKWRIKAEGPEQIWQAHETRETAVNQALDLARAVGRGRVLVHDRAEALDGRFD